MPGFFYLYTMADNRVIDSNSDAIVDSNGDCVVYEDSVVTGVSDITTANVTTPYKHQLPSTAFRQGKAERITSNNIKFE